MGSGRNGTFDKIPDWQQWALLLVAKNDGEAPLISSFIKRWYRFFGCEVFNILLQPVEGHGQWDGSEAFGPLPRQSDYEGQLAVLTRATIRINKLKYFWQHVAPVAQKMNEAGGFLFSIGIGEIPWIKQATFSVWSSKDAMKAFAYGTKEHTQVIQRTKQQRWYSEDMFVRFKIVETNGSLRGKKPLKS